MAFDLPADYKQVPERIADLKEKHPDARLRPVNPDKPFEIVTVGDRTFVVYAAACYRDADDPLPAIGVAWEPFPGRTPYTKDSELMNAETSAWGRAIVAALRSESKAIASAEDVRNRRADQEVSPPPRGSVRRAPSRPPHDPETGELRQAKGKGASDAQLRFLAKLGAKGDLSDDELVTFASATAGRDIAALTDLSTAEASAVIDALQGIDAQ